MAQDQKTIVIFDIDSTLTPPRQPIAQEMVDILGRLSVPFAVAAGSSLDLLEGQFFQPLGEQGFQGTFDAFINNGVTRYRCVYDGSKKMDLVSDFDFKKHLGQENYEKLIKKLNEILELERFKLPDEINPFKNKIKDRFSMINFVPMGRAQVEKEQAIANRSAFVEFDKKTGYRKKVIEFLEKELSDMIKEKDLRILFGGQTSFDVLINGYDKTYPLRIAQEEGFDEVIFIGDALFPDGNDYVVQEYVDNWKEKRPCPVKAIKTTGWEETIEILQKLKFI